MASVDQKLHENIAAIRVFMWPERGIVPAAMAVAQSLNGGFKELDQAALDGDDGKSLTLKRTVSLATR